MFLKKEKEAVERERGRENQTIKERKRKQKVAYKYICVCVCYWQKVYKKGKCLIESIKGIIVRKKGPIEWRKSRARCTGRVEWNEGRKENSRSTVKRKRYVWVFSRGN